MVGTTWLQGAIVYAVQDARDGSFDASLGEIFSRVSSSILPLLGAGLYVALLVSEPWAALAAGGVIYAALIPFGVRSYRRLKAEAEMMGAPDEEQGRLTA